MLFKSKIHLLLTQNTKEIKCDISVVKYSFKIFLRFWLAKTTRIIHHNQLLLTKFGRILPYMERNRWRQIIEPLTKKTWGQDWVVLVKLIITTFIKTRFKIQQSWCGRIQTTKLNFLTKHNKTNVRILRIYNYNNENST